MVARASAGVGNAPYVVAQSSVPYTLQSVAGAGDAIYTVLKQVNIPALDPNDTLEILTCWDTLTAGSKYLGIDLGGTTMGGVTNFASSIVTLDIRTSIANMNSRNSQTAFNSASYGTQTIARASATIDTSVPSLLEFKARWSAAQADALQTIILRRFQVIRCPEV